MNRGHPSLGICRAIPRRLDGGNREHNVISVLFEFQDQLDRFKLIGDAKIYCRRGTEEIHCVGAFTGPRIDIFEVKAGFFLLNKYSHTLHTAPRSLPFPAD
jgi:hypothetical protein